MKLVRYAAALASAAALALSTSSAGAAPPTDSVQAVPMATMPSSCWGGYVLAHWDGFEYGSIDGLTVFRNYYYRPNYPDYDAQPKAWANTGYGWVSTRADGSAWLHTTGAMLSIESQRIAGSGWGGIRQMTSGRSALVYALSGSSLVRYTFSATGLTSRTVLATSGWNSVREIASADQVTMNGRVYDALYALTSTGGLNLYLVPVAGSGIIGSVLKPTTWGGMSQLTIGSCDTAGAAIYALSSAGRLYAYYDARRADRSGADLRGLGMIALGISGNLKG